MAKKTGSTYTLCAIKGEPLKATRRRRRRPWHLSPEGFRALRHSCFLTPEACAQYLGVSLRTVRHWDAGRCRVPWSAVRLLRLRRLGDLGALEPAWAGWTLNRNGLWSPDGKQHRPDMMKAWWLVCEQARFWRDDYDRRTLGGVGASAPARPQAVEPLTSEPLQGRVLGTQLATSMDQQHVLPPRPTAFLAFGYPVPFEMEQPPGRREAALPPAGPVAVAFEMLRQAIANMPMGGALHDANMMSICNHVSVLPDGILEATMTPEPASLTHSPHDLPPLRLVPSANRGLKSLNPHQSDVNLASPPSEGE